MFQTKVARLEEAKIARVGRVVLPRMGRLVLSMVRRVLLLRRLPKRRSGVPHIAWVALLVKRLIVAKVGRVLVMKVQRRQEVKVSRMVVVKMERRPDVKVAWMVVLKVVRVTMTESKVVTTTSLRWTSNCRASG